MMSQGTINTNTMTEALIAPCGMNCRLCRAYVRERKACPGCRGSGGFKSKACSECRIRNCEKLVNADIKFCFGCDSFPCDRLKHLDKRYRTRYGMSMMENLENIRRFGIGHFIGMEKEWWTCPGCGGIICVHKPQCLSCHYMWR
jgi:hypothetical protein